MVKKKKKSGNVIQLPVERKKPVKEDFPDKLFFDQDNLTGKYLLDDKGEPYECPGLFKWAQALEATKIKWRLKDTVGSLLISTVFLGLDHGLLGVFEHEDDPKYVHVPILWETMIFAQPGGKVDYAGQSHDIGEAMWRHWSRTDAYAFHHQKVREMKRLLEPK